MFNIPNFQIIQSLYDSENSSVYRAIRSLDQRPVILKWSKADFPTVTQLARYQHEYELLHQLNLPGVIQAYSLEKFRDHLILVLEDVGGDSLNRWLTRRAFTVIDGLSLAIQIADSLGQVHAAQVIHKDVNPNNLVWNSSTATLKLIDFGIATRLPRETLSLQNPNQLEGTLPYLSPEQTGRMNRALDYRTDLYSLGVTLYELFTGRLPFESQDAMELVHCHLAKSPKLPHQIKADVPPVISHLILRLMAKAAEERYQSAWGVKADLEQILTNLTGLEDLSGFKLGRHDFSDHFHLPQKLYGREEAVAPLFAAFEQITQGHSELLLVAGYSGIGKTAVVQEIYKPITEKRGYFIAGKFDQFQRNIPYSAMVQAFRDLVRQLLTENQAQLDDWKAKILTAVGNNGQVIIDVISEVELIIGSQPAVPTLPPTESQNRFNLVFQNFIKVFCQPSHPLVIFLDDLQWIDSASLKLMTLMMSDIPYLLLIGAYRDNEVSSVHPLMTTLEEMQKQGLQVQTLTLTPLALSHLNQLVSDTLHLPLALTLPLAELVLEKTGGNPFFMGEFLKTLYVEHLLEFNASHRQWQWDLAKIKARNITANVVELMMGKIQRLATTTQQVLTLAAAIGNQFDLATLSVVSQQSSEWVKTQLWEALVDGLMVPLGERYKFVHDRVQQAAYSLIPEGERPALHWQIGQLLLNQPQIVEDRLFEIVDHLNLGLALVDTSTTKIQMARLNLQAGQKAKLATAYRMAAEYLRHSHHWLTPAHWQTDYDLTLAVHTELVEVLYSCSDFDQMETIADIILQQARTPLDQVIVYEVQERVYAGQAQLPKAIQTARAGLSRFGVVFPEKPTEADIAAALADTAARWQGAPISELVNLPQMTSPNELAITRLLTISISATYQGQPELFPLIVSKLINLFIEYGNTEQSPFAYDCYGLLLCGIMEIETGYQFGQLAIQLLEQLNLQVNRAKVAEGVYGLINPWKEHLSGSCRHLKEAYYMAIEEGDLEFAGYTAMLHCSYAYFGGQPLGELAERFTFFLQELTALKQDNCVYYLTIHQQSILSLRQEISSPTLITELTEDSQKLLGVFQNTNNYFGLFQFHTNRLFLCYLFEAPTLALAQATVAKPYIAVAGNFAVAWFYFYESLSQLAIYLDSDSAKREEILQQVSVNQENMKHWAYHAPMNFQHKYDLVAAEQARVLGQFELAAKGYEKAITGARENEYLQEEALAYELAAKFYLAQEMEKIAHTYLTEAYQRYQRWGAVAKLKHLEQQYPQWLPPSRVATVMATHAATVKHTATVLSSSQMATTRLATGTDWLDLTSVMKAAQTLSDEMVLENLLEKMMHTVVENAGAQRGVLILEDQGQWLIQAELTVQPETVTVLQAFSLAGRVPTTLLNYVIRTKQSAVFADLQREAKYQTDDYVRTQALKSVLCLTLLHQQKLVGVIYLENNLTTGAFTHDRFQVLTLLSSQMAISLDNARFVRELQQARQVAEEAHQAEIQARQAAEAANQAKTAFLANVSHELRTPLNGILGYTQLLQQDSQLTVKQQEAVSTIHRSGEHLLILVSDILDISKLQTGRLELQPTEVHFSQLLTALTDWFRDQAKEKGLTFRYEPSPYLPTGIVADGKRLRQVLLHLLSNAVKFTQHGGITFQVQSASLPNRLGWHQFQFIVTDTGIGMTAADLSRLFTPFEQVSDWLHKSAGAGLGLSLAKQLVELMGGQIQVQSSPGQGSTFTVKLDLAESQEWQSVSTSVRISDQSETSPRPIAQTLEEVTSPLKGPPADQAAELYELCQIGDFFGILQLVTQFEQEDAELGPFVAKVRQWAKDFHDELIEELAQQFMTN